MTKNEFFNQVTNTQSNVLTAFFDFLLQDKAGACVIGGLAVNAYADPVISLDLDLVVVASELENILLALQDKFKIEKFLNSVNLYAAGSDLRIQFQTDPRYQDFISRAKNQQVLGYCLPVAAIEDVLQGKIWAASDPTRRPSKRQKDLADIMRLIEARPDLSAMVPQEISERLKL